MNFLSKGFQKFSEHLQTDRCERKRNHAAFAYILIVIIIIIIRPIIIIMFKLQVFSVVFLFVSA